MKIKNYSKHIANNVGVDAHIDPKSKKGITLIALVITIIVLLILAGVALSVSPLKPCNWTIGKELINYFFT